MSATDRTVVVKRILPRIAAVTALPPSSIQVTWAEGDRKGTTETVDLAPMIYLYKLYTPLRANPALFRTVHTVANGALVAWGGDDAIDMTASAVHELAQEGMTAAEFKAFLARNGLTLDAAAAQLGVSRRLVAYYAKGRTIPRVV